MGMCVHVSVCKVQLYAIIFMYCGICIATELLITYTGTTPRGMIPFRVLIHPILIVILSEPL